MINDLRKSYGESMPFYYAQLANYFNYGGMLPHFRQIQSDFLNLKKNCMIWRRVWSTGFRDFPFL